MYTGSYSIREELYGPRTAFGQVMHSMKHRAPEESFDDYCVRYARAVAGEDRTFFYRLLPMLRNQEILPAGRQQLAVGRPYGLTGFNCFVGPQIPDDTSGIFDVVKQGALTMRAGGGVGWDFSTLRPEGDRIMGLGAGAYASGPVSFMAVWNSMCTTIMSAGERRGAMMGMLRVDHPDVLKFVNAKRNTSSLTNFNISVAVTDAFMEALYADGLYKLRFNGNDYSDARAQDIWAVIMESNWDWAEPGVVFIDRINKLNPLCYCETIHATNPCAEQPLPPQGACLLSSLNIAKFLRPIHEVTGKANISVIKKTYDIDFDSLADAVDATVRANDAVIDRTNYPLPEQKHEALQKRRMGVGDTGMANALEVCGFPYASEGYLALQEKVLEFVNTQAYRTSCNLAQEKGSFPLFDAEKYCEGLFFKTRLPEELQNNIRRYGLRNGLLTSIAPTGTISMDADNVSGGIEPVIQIRGRRVVLTPNGSEEFDFVDYAAQFYGVEGRTSEQVTAEEHIDVLCNAQKYVDSAISKTCNVQGQVAGKGAGVPYEDFVKLYLRAWEGGAKSCSTFNLNGKRMGIFRQVEPQGESCVFDPESGTRSCEV